MMQRYIYKILFLLWGISSCGVLYSQVLINYGAKILANPGSHIHINGSIQNKSNGQLSINYNSGINAEMYVTGDVINDAILTCNGHIRLLGNWYNNSIFTSTTGTVFFEGANQLLAGSVPTHFFNITLDGSGFKTQQIDQFATGVLDLKHLELQTETHAFFMQNTAANAIIRTTGFVSSLNGGFLSRNTNASVMYLFPTGSSVGIMRYRPVELSPLAATSNTYTVRLANLNAGTEGNNTASIASDICEVNPLFYHQIDRSSGTAAVNMNIFFDAAADGDWEGIAKWQTPANEWNIVTGSTVTPGSPLSVASKAAWNDFSNIPYILHRSNVPPIFDSYGPYCEGETPDALPSVSLNGISGSWSPATINTSNAGTTTYTFTPSIGECGFAYTMNITVNPLPIVNLGSDQSVCINNMPVTLDAGSGLTSYLWSNGSPNQTTIISTGGNYSVTVTNSFGCSASDAITITVNPLPVVSISGLASQYCLNSGSVSLTGTPAGGIFSGTGVTGNTFNPAVAGVGIHTITYTYTDGNSCTNTIINTTQVTSVPELSVSEIIVPGCNGDASGSISLSVVDGTPSYTYTWSPATGTNGSSATNLSAGTYSITVEDAYGCSNSIEVLLQNPDPIEINITINNHVLCYGESSGSAIAGVSGGFPPYTYSWNSPGSTNQAYNNNLPAGTWTLTVSDANGCSVSQQISITQPNILDIQFINVDNVSCFGLADGAATAMVIGGTGPYLYEWDDPGHTTLSTAVNLPLGTYNVTITDANGCTLTDFVHISQPDPLELTTSSLAVQCGISLGSASVQVLGGTVPYDYLWTGGYTSSQISGLASGTYRLTVTDARGCVAEAVVYVGMQGSGIVTITEDQAISCFGLEDAILTANITNGVPPISYAWSNSGNAATIQNLSAGIYSVTVSDSWGCSGFQSFMVVEPPDIVLNFSSSPVSCFGGNDGTATVAANGGSSPYTYTWDNGSSLSSVSDLFAGNYVVTVTDSHNCPKTGTVSVSQPENPITFNLQTQNISCFGLHDGEINLVVTGGIPPYDYQWQIGSYTTSESNISDLYEGLYNLQVTDVNQCYMDTTVVISQPAQLSATWASEGPSCIGNNDGYIDVVVSGGTSPYVFAWQTGVSPIEYISGLIEGDYLITIQDSSDCTLEIGPIALFDTQEECLRIPDAFTPNNDGINDTWIVDNIDLYPQAFIEIFNRWGQCVFEAKATEQTWDGYYDGKPLPTAPYIYVINLYNGDKPKTGIVTLIR